MILHAASTDGGASFRTRRPIAWLRRGASRSGIVTTLAVSRLGRMGICWSQSRSPHRYDPVVACKITDHWVVEPCAPHSAEGRLAGIPPRSGVPGRAALGRRICLRRDIDAAGGRRRAAPWIRPPDHGEPVAGARVTHLRPPRTRMSRHGDVHRRLHRARRHPTASRHRLHRTITESLPAKPDGHLIAAAGARRPERSVSPRIPTASRPETIA